MAKAKRISQGGVENCVVRNYVCPSFLFIDNSTHIHCSSSGRPRFPGLTHHYHHSLLPSSTICDKRLTMSIILVSTKSRSRNWTSSSPPERTQCRQGSMGSTGYHCSTRGDCSTNWNDCLIDAGKLTGSTLQWYARPFYDSSAICSPSQTSLIINQASFLHTSQGPGVTVRVFSKDDEVNESGGLEGLFGM